MILLALIGVVLVVIAVAVGVDVWQVNTGHVLVKAFNHTFSQPTWALFAAGAVSGALFLVGLEMVLIAGARNKRGEETAARHDRFAAQDQEATIASEEPRPSEEPARVSGVAESDTLARRNGRGAHFAPRR
jgi:hypothetical protein